MTAGGALLATVAIELPLWVAGLLALRLCGPVRAVVLGIGVNLVTHPVLWRSLDPGPGIGTVLAAEACVVVIEAAIVRLLTGRDVGLALLLALGANAASFAVGLLLAATA